MLTYEHFMDSLKKAERHFSRLLSHLDSSRTLTLSELLHGSPKIESVLHAPWLQSELIARRLKESIAWLSKIPHIREPETCEGFFLQRNLISEDTLELREHEGSYFFKEQFEKKYGQASLEVRYLHTETNFYRELVDTAQSLVIHPWTHFSTPSEYREETLHGLIGYRVPNYANLLDVRDVIATDYLTRIIVHDVGHHYLPDTECHEDMHNSAMIKAVGIQPIEYLNAWEELIHRECTDPAFFVDAIAMLDDLPKTFIDDPTKAFIVQAYRDLYTRADQYPPQFNWQDTFCIHSEIDLRTARSKALHKIDQAFETGFALYSKSSTQKTAP